LPGFPDIDSIDAGKLVLAIAGVGNEQDSHEYAREIIFISYEDNA
jgi:hypothetical protein